MKRMQTGFLSPAHMGCMICQQPGNRTDPNAGTAGELIPLPIGQGCNPPAHYVHIHCLCELWLQQNQANFGAMFRNFNSDMEIMQAAMMLEPRLLVVACQSCGNRVDLNTLENFQVGMQVLRLMFFRLALGRYREITPPGTPIPPFLLGPVQHLWNTVYPGCVAPPDLT